MQASKIIVGKVYAIKADDMLKRFHVTAVVQRRTAAHGNPRDFQSSVEGWIEAADRRASDDPNGQTMTVVPGAILGPYEEYEELVERKAQEKAKVEAATAAKEALREELADLLRRVGGIEEAAIDEDRPRYSQPSPSVEAFYSGVRVSDEAAAQVVAGLRQLLG